MCNPSEDHRFEQRSVLLINPWIPPGCSLRASQVNLVEHGRWVFCTNLLLQSGPHVKPFWQLFLNIFDVIHVHRNRLSSRSTTRRSHERPASRRPYKLAPTRTFGSSTETQLLGRLNFCGLRTILFWQMKSLGRFLHLDLLLCADGVPWLTTRESAGKRGITSFAAVRSDAEAPCSVKKVLSSVFVSSNVSPHCETAFFLVFLLQRGMHLMKKVLQRCDVNCLLFFFCENSLFTFHLLILAKHASSSIYPALWQQLLSHLAFSLLEG